jgi:hypothetical protein
VPGGLAENALPLWSSVDRCLATAVVSWSQPSQQVCMSHHVLSDFLYCCSMSATVHDEPRSLFYSFLITSTIGCSPWASEQPAARQKPPPPPLPVTYEQRAPTKVFHAFTVYVLLMTAYCKEHVGCLSSVNGRDSTPGKDQKCFSTL